MSDQSRRHGPDPSSIDYRTAAGDGLGAHVGYGDREALFDMHFDEIRSAQVGVSQLGLLVLAYDVGTAALASRHWIKGRHEAIDSMVVGRHRKCDLALGDDPAISLRHLLLMTHPHRPGAKQLSFRAMDLRTSLGFSDCFSNRLEGLVSDGPAMLSLGRYALLLLPTGVRPVAESRREAWNQIADPVYLEQHTQMVAAAERGAAGRGGAEARDGGLACSDAGAARTTFTIVDGPQRAGAGLLDRNEALYGTLTISARDRSEHLLVGRRAASHGILLGSYDRCDDACLAHVADVGISRVHVVVVLHKEKLYAIDAASTNGCFAQRSGRRVKLRIAKLSPLFELLLADDRARLRWDPE